jgi:sugar-specific transcriptional regulator TrmB
MEEENNQLKNEIDELKDQVESRTDELKEVEASRDELYDALHNVNHYMSLISDTINKHI